MHRALAPLERERTGDDTNGQCTCFAGELGNHGGRTRTGAATFAGSNEHHVGALHHFFDLFLVCFSRLATNFRVAAGTKATSQIATDIKLDISVAHQKRLCVGVDRNELNALQAGIDHAVDSIHAAAADTDDLDHGEIVLWSTSHQRIPLSCFVRRVMSFISMSFPCVRLGIRSC